MECYRKMFGPSSCHNNQDIPRIITNIRIILGSALSEINNTYDNTL